MSLLGDASSGVRRKPKTMAAWILLPLLAGCTSQLIPTQPSVVVVSSVRVVSLEAEAGSGDGQVVQRSRASGGKAVHVGPGERRLWTFDVRTVQVQYVLSVTYSNGKEGPNEVIALSVDGTRISSFQNRDSGDSTEGWNVFVTDPAGTSTLSSGRHTLTLEVSGGDGCVEIDFVTLQPDAAGPPNGSRAP